MAEPSLIPMTLDQRNAWPSANALSRISRRRAFSLLELVAVVLLLGLVSIAAVGRFSSTTLENLDAAGYAERVALDLAQARERTIATGDNHYLEFTVTAGQATSYVIMRRASGGDVAVAPVETTPAGLSISVSNAQMEFDFDGSALDAYLVNVASPDRTYSVTVARLTGSVKSEDVTL